MLKSDKFRPIKRFPNLSKSLLFGCDLLLIKLFCGFDSMSFHSKGSCNYLITKISFPKFIVFYNVCIAVTDRKINVEIFDLFGYLLLQTTLFLFYFNNIFVGVPVSFNSLQRLFKKKWQILCLLHTHS
jgi:hypothetical protein